MCTRFKKSLLQYSLKSNEIYKFAHKWTFQKTILKTTPFGVEFFRTPIIKTVSWSGDTDMCTFWDSWRWCERSLQARVACAIKVEKTRDWCLVYGGKWGRDGANLDDWSWGMNVLPEKDTSKDSEQMKIQLTWLKKTFCWPPIARM